MLVRIFRKISHYHRRRQEEAYQRCMAGYKINAAKPVIDRLHGKVVRYAKRAVARGNDNLMNELFFISFFVKAQKEPDEAGYNKWLHDFARLSFQTGERHRGPLQAWPRKTPRLAFIGLGDDPSAYDHIYHLCNYLHKSGSYKPYLFLFSPHNNLDRITAHFQQAETPVIIVPFNESIIIESCVQMRDALAKEEINIAAWVHLPTLMFALFGMGVAEKQVFISQYLHPDLARFDIDGLMTYGNIADKESVFLKDKWRTIPSSLDMPVKPSPDHQELRKQFAKDDTHLLATFGRIEKIRQKDFLRCVAGILRKVPKAVYLYTGYEDDSDIASFFLAYNLADRIKFIGWVDIDAYLPIVDLVLDSFPLATGITALKAMAYGKPVLSMGNAYSYMGRDIKPVIDQQVFKGFDAAKPVFFALKEKLSFMKGRPYALDEQDYIAKAVAFLSDKRERTLLIDFQQLCARQLYCNTDLMGEIFVEQLNEIAAQT